MTDRDSTTRTRARTPGEEDYRVTDPTLSGIFVDTNAMHEGRKQTNTWAAYAGSRLKLSGALGRRRPKCHPSSRTGENPPYGMLGGIEETSASFEARSAPRSYPTVRGGWEVLERLAVPDHVHSGVARARYYDRGLLIRGSLPRGGTTMSAKAAMPAASGAQGRLKPAGELVAPVPRNWRRARPSCGIRHCGSLRLLSSRSSERSRRSPPVLSRISAEKIPKTGGLPGIFA
jgi:hypothetical protein